jgi:RimJ/RimL family protein N-acetyltransferase
MDERGEATYLVAWHGNSPCGPRIIAAAEERAGDLGAHRIGLAVEHGNGAARRLYERLGYLRWPGPDVVDRWAERDGGGRVVREHADPCSYLVKEPAGAPPPPAGSGG